MNTSIHVIGHVCHDKVKDGFILGGTASYGSLMASKLFKDVILTTSFGGNFLFLNEFKNRAIEVDCLHSSETTVFENIYNDQGRIQYLHNKASNIDINKIKEIDPNVIFLCPIANELLGNIQNLKKEDILLVATLQGWLRSFAEDGKVLEHHPDLQTFQGLDIVILSDDDIKGFPDILKALIGIIPIVVVTLGAKGANVFHDGKKTHSSSYETTPIDLTGAGDVFALAFIFAFVTRRDIKYSSSFAHAAASLSIEGKGVASLPSKDEILSRLFLYDKKYIRE